MSDLPNRFCEICGIIHPPPIHDLSRCYPKVMRFSQLLDPDEWPTKEEIQDGLAYWDAVFTDKGLKPLS
jgi:hypothetical protein